MEWRRDHPILARIGDAHPKWEQRAIERDYIKKERKKKAAREAALKKARDTQKQKKEWSKTIGGLQKHKDAFTNEELAKHINDLVAVEEANKKLTELRQAKINRGIDYLKQTADAMVQVKDIYSTATGIYEIALNMKKKVEESNQQPPKPDKVTQELENLNKQKQLSDAQKALSDSRYESLSSQKKLTDYMAELKKKPEQKSKEESKPKEETKPAEPPKPKYDNPIVSEYARRMLSDIDERGPDLTNETRYLNNLLQIENVANGRYDKRDDKNTNVSKDWSPFKKKDGGTSEEKSKGSEEKPKAPEEKPKTREEKTKELEERAKGIEERVKAYEEKNKSSGNGKNQDLPYARWLKKKKRG
jgi:hypothetical protein